MNILIVIFFHWKIKQNSDLQVSVRLKFIKRTIEWFVALQCVSSLKGFLEGGFSVGHPQRIQNVLLYQNMPCFVCNTKR